MNECDTMKKITHRQHVDGSTRFRRSDDTGQMIVMMGVLLVISIVVLGSLAAEIADVDVIVSNQRSTSLLQQYLVIEEAFHRSLQYNLTSIRLLQGQYRTLFFGSIQNVTQAFNNTRDRFFIFALRYNMIFNATLNDYWYSHPANNGDVYYVDVTLALTDGLTSIERDVLYTVRIRPVVGDESGLL